MISYATLASLMYGPSVLHSGFLYYRSLSGVRGKRLRRVASVDLEVKPERLPPSDRVARRRPCSERLSLWTRTPTAEASASVVTECAGSTSHVKPVVWTMSLGSSKKADARCKSLEGNETRY